MYRRMNPNQLEKIIEENRKINELKKILNSPENPEKVVFSVFDEENTDTPNLDRP